MLCSATGELAVIVGLAQVTLFPVGPVTVQSIAPAGVNPAVPVTTTESVVLPPKVVALLVIAPIVGRLWEMVVVMVLEESVV